MGQFSNLQTNRHIQLNSALQPQPNSFIKQNIAQEANGNAFNTQPAIQMQANGRTLLKLGQNQAPPMQPAVQINIQSLIKPLPPTDKPLAQPVPIVYSFGQPDFGSKYLPVFGEINAHEKSVPNKKFNWGVETNFDYEDDFADILG